MPPSSLKVVLGLLLIPWALSFGPVTIFKAQRRIQSSKKSLLITSQSSQSPDSESLDDESPEERKARMDLVRQLQQSFYQNEDTILPPSKGSTIIEHLPLWRVQWTELPGFQNVLNVHVAHYTNMFQKILFSDSNPKYFGHIYLPDGSVNLDNPDYKLEEGSKSSMVGTLMQITDYKQMDDGRLTLIVQALEKFRIVEAERHHSPYAIATVEMVVDDEFVESFNDGLDDKDRSIDDVKAVESAFEFHPYEVRPVAIADCLMEGETEGISVSPLANFDSEYKLPKSISAKDTTIDLDDPVFDIEQKVWIKVDEMISLLRKLVDPNNEQTLPIPTQILGLLPLEPQDPWPKGFTLESYATKLEIEKILVGTFSKSPFVRVDTMEGYSPYRRAQRLSYMIPVLTDTVIALGDETGNTRQNYLEMESTEERLGAALQKLELICSVILDLLENK